jgi:hexosaminidase
MICMKFKLCLAIAILAAILSSCTNKNDYLEANYEWVPIPKSVVFNDTSDVYFLDQSSLIVYDKDCEELKKLSEFLSSYIYESTGIKLKVAEDDGQSNVIRLKLIIVKNQTETNPDSYDLSINKDGISISGVRGSGIFYGIQTLRKSLPIENTSKIAFKAISVNDAPTFQHRGALLDVSRHFYPIDFIKKYIDVLALYNMNVFHWHLTDDQGWRIEVKKYPKLTEIGSQRSETAIDRHSEEYDGKPYGGYYTQQEIKEIVEYARQRYITVIPEIDIPGHTLAALTSYPELGCTGGPYQVGRGWGIYEDVLCVGNDSVFTFLNDVFSEVVELFPAKYIHIGGDECLKNRWMHCPKCQKRIKDLNLKPLKAHSVEEQLQSYFIHRVEEIINSKGKSIIGWDEILEGGIAPNATIMSWRGTEGGIYAAEKGHDVIMTPESHVYLDYYQSDEVDKEPYTFGWLTELKKTYSFDPMPKELSEDKRKHILGAQVNVWTEYMPTSDNVEYMLLPRMAALAETLWSYPKEKDYNDFVSRMYWQSLLLDKLGYKNAKHIYGVQADYKYDTENQKIAATLSTFDNLPIYYTLDGSEPSDKSNLYTDPIIINNSATLKAVLYRNEKKSDIYSKSFSFNKATLRPIVLKNQPYNKYIFKGAITLVDGETGYKQSYRTGSWIGFIEDLEAVIKLENQTSVSSVSLNTFVNTRGGLFGAKSLIVQISDDGVNFSTVAKNDYPIPSEHLKPQVVSIDVNFEPIKTNYIKVVAENTGNLPDWTGKRYGYAYLMVDEIVVK